MAKKTASSKSAKAVKVSAKAQKKTKETPKPKSLTKAKKIVKKTASIKESVHRPKESKKTEQVKSVKVEVSKSVKPEKVKATKKNKASIEIESDNVKIKIKPNVVSLIEDDVESTEASEVNEKAEKVSKVKPIKVERGNLSDEKAKWAELNKKYGKEKALPYKMSEQFGSMQPLQHKVLGWGFILTNENDRLEVLFETGIRMLISNYKS